MWWLVILLLCALVLDTIVKSTGSSTSYPTDDLSNRTRLPGEGREVCLVGPRDHGELQWSTMSDWTYR